MKRMCYPPQVYRAERRGCRGPVTHWSKGVSWPHILHCCADLLGWHYGQKWPPHPWPTRSCRQSGKISDTPECNATDGQPRKCWQDMKFRKGVCLYEQSNQNRPWFIIIIFRFICLHHVTATGVFEANVRRLACPLHNGTQLTVQEILALVGERIIGFCRYTVTSPNSLCTCLWSRPCSVGLPSETIKTLEKKHKILNGVFLKVKKKGMLLNEPLLYSRLRRRPSNNGIHLKVLPLCYSPCVLAGSEIGLGSLRP